ncbi:MULTISPECIES: hypothetical protein [Serratia]|uniref:hypothetical protein n=1 Tax=Serratia TaxID=613 RepID=UPI00065F8852|nr:hypothetical protein [Serratia sp. 506_PEND]
MTIAMAMLTHCRRVTGDEAQAPRKRWVLWALVLMAVGVTPLQSARAAGDIIVMSSQNVKGDTGARFTTVIPSTFVDVKGPDWGGLCLSGEKHCTGGDWTAIELDGSWGFTPKTGGGVGQLGFVPHGVLYATPGGGKASANDSVISMSYPDGHYETGTTPGGIGCSPRVGDDSRTFFSQGTPRSPCPSRSERGHRAYWAGNLSGTLTLNAYALQPLKPGSISFPALYAAYYSYYSARSSIALPSRIVVTGLNCSFASPSTVEVPFGVVMAGQPPGTALAQKSLPLTVTCAGTNSPDAAVNASVEIHGQSGTIVDANGIIPVFSQDIIVTHLDNNGAGCTGGLDLTRPIPWHTYQPGEAGGAQTHTLNFTLCSAGTDKQESGNYAATVTAQLVTQ